MADRNLTEEEWREFWHIPFEEQFERCKHFSAHDSFRFRITDPGISAHQPWVPCNDCAYRISKTPTCRAYPSGLSADHIRAIMEDQTIECGDGFHYTPKEEKDGG